MLTEIQKKLRIKELAGDNEDLADALEIVFAWYEGGLPPKIDLHDTIEDATLGFMMGLRPGRLAHLTSIAKANADKEVRRRQ